MKKVSSRRQFLQMSILAGAGGVLTACASGTSTPQIVQQTVPVKETVIVKETSVVEVTPTPIQEPIPSGPVTVSMMTNAGSISDEQLAQFEADSGDITLEILPGDTTRLSAMWAAGEPPDLWITNAAILGLYLTKKQVMNLNPFLEISQLVKLDDLAPCHKLLSYEGINIGAGNLYGIASDWSNDPALWVNTDAFNEANVPVPDDTKPITYAEFAQLSESLTKKEGQRTLRWGSSCAMITDGFFGITMAMLGQSGSDLYSPAFDKMVLVDNPIAVDIFKYWFDLCMSGSTQSPIDPSPTWAGEDFTKGSLAILQAGYWFSGMAESDVTKDKVKFLPAPDWGTAPHWDPCLAATCHVMGSETKHPEAAWKVLEYYTAGEPGIARAKSGWGIPPLKSNYDLMPNETPFRQQVMKVLQSELEYSEHVIRYNPFYGVQAVGWGNNLIDGLRGNITFEKMLENIEDEHNKAISDSISRLG